MKVTLIAAFLLATDCEKDLGNWITSKLQPSTQCQKAYTVAVKRTFKFVSKESLNIQYYIKLYMATYQILCLSLESILYKGY